MKISINEYKKNVISIVDEAEQSKWIAADEAQAIRDQFETDELTIGVIGQMNVGKSTLINSLVFGQEVLPTSEIPMTAALTYICYGEKTVANVEMLSLSDYEEIKQKSQQEITEENKSETESAQRIIKSIEAIPSYKEMMGKSIEIAFKEFDEYVGAGGKYTALVKFMRMSINNPDLKGVCVVDTPGYNDPVSSRDLTTKKFLSKANVIIMVQDIQAHFSKPDVELIKDQIPKSGIGKLVVVLNKKDSISVDDLAKVMENVGKHKDEIAQQNVEIEPLLKACKIIPVSSVMSLIGQMSQDEININESLAFWKSEIEYYFPELKPKDYLGYSGIPDLQAEVSDIVMNQKKEILLYAPCEKLKSLLVAFLNKCDIEKESLMETNGFLSDQQIDLNSVMEDLKNFEKTVIEYLYDTMANCEGFAVSKVEDCRYSLRDIRNGELEKIDFEEIHKKTYLRCCFNNIEEVYCQLNNAFGNRLRELGNGISDHIHEEVADLERKMNLIVLHNSKLIHSSVIKRISRVIDATIPRSLVNNRNMEATFPEWSDRQDIYQIGIKSFFKKMVQDSFNNEYINNITSIYFDRTSKIIDTIEKEIEGVVADTKKQYETNDVIKIEDKIKNNEERIDEIEKAIPKVNELIQKVSQLNND